jgi:hypothetical protein
MTAVGWLRLCLAEEVARGAIVDLPVRVDAQGVVGQAAKTDADPAHLAVVVQGETHGHGELAPSAGTLAVPRIGLVPVLGAVGDEGSSPTAHTGPLGAALGVIDQDPEGTTVAVAAHRLDDLSTR